MKSRVRFIAVIALGVSLLMALVAIPIFAAATASIKNSGATAAITWSRQGGQITLEVTDTALDKPIKRVVFQVTSDVNLASGTATTVAGSATLTGVNGVSLFGSTTPPAVSLSVGDSILVGEYGNETVRRITAIASTSSLTVNKPFKNATSSASLWKVVNALAIEAKCPECAFVERLPALVGTGTKFVNLVGIPVSDSGLGGGLANRFNGSKDTIVNLNDVLVVGASATVATGISVVGLDGSSGLITGSQTAADLTPKDVYAAYWGSAANDTASSVKAVSNSDPTGITVTLNETGPTTAVFRSQLDLVSGSSSSVSSPPQLQVGKNDTVTLKYGTKTASVTVETTDSVFSNLTPAHDFGGGESRPVVQGDITDADSGVVKAKIKIIFGVDTNLDNDIETSAEVDVTTDGDIFTITAGYQAKQRLPASLAPSADAYVYWWIKAEDTAGNVSITDRQTTISSVADACVAASFPSAANLVGKDVTTTGDVAGCQPRRVKVDFTAPAVSTAFTGYWWDDTKTGSARIITDPAKAKLDSIRLDFNEDLDGTTVAASDFKVAGVAPLAANWYSGDKDSVYLTVATLASNARPKVELVSEVKDAAGNPKTTGSVSLAVDRIAPALTLTITGSASSRPLAHKAKKLTIVVVADEDIGTPLVTVFRVGGASAGSSGDTIGAGGLASSTSVTMVLTATRTYQGTFDPSDTEGLYNVHVVGKDAAAQNERKVGLDTSASDQDTAKIGVQIKLASASLFEVDANVEAPTIGPATTDDPNTFITIDFTNEGKEYGLDTNKVFTIDPAAVVTSYDTHGTVTITSATLGTVDIKSALNSADNKVFLYKASGLAEGTHTVKVKAKDNGGNEKEFTGTVKVKAKALFSIKLNPGWNLVSIPGAPKDDDINTVIPATLTSVTSVVSYDPSAPGGWMTAIRGDDGKFTGTLTKIDANMAYWVLTSTFEPIKVDIPTLSAGIAMLPPTLSLPIGWSLVPVLDVTGAKSAGDGIAPKTYFAGLTISRAYTFNTVENQWQLIDAAATTLDLKVGTGYWVYLTKAGTLVP